MCATVFVACKTHRRVQQSSSRATVFVACKTHRRVQQSSSRATVFVACKTQVLFSLVVVLFADFCAWNCLGFWARGFISSSSSSTEAYLVGFFTVSAFLATHVGSSSCPSSEDSTASRIFFGTKLNAQNWIVDIQSRNPSVKLAKNQRYRRVADASWSETRRNRRESRALLNHHTGFSGFVQSGETLRSCYLVLQNLLSIPTKLSEKTRLYVDMLFLQALWKVSASFCDPRGFIDFDVFAL